MSRCTKQGDLETPGKMSPGGLIAHLVYITQGSVDLKPTPSALILNAFPASGIVSSSLLGDSQALPFWLLLASLHGFAAVWKSGLPRWKDETTFHIMLSISTLGYSSLLTKNRGLSPWNNNCTSFYLSPSGQR